MRLDQGHIKYGVPRTFLYRGYKIPKKNSPSKLMQYLKKATPTASTTNIFRRSRLTTYKTGSIIKGTIFLLFISPKSLLACLGGGADYEWDEDLPQKPLQNILDMTSSEENLHNLNVTKIKDPIDRNRLTAWQGWTPPPEVQNEWRLWLHKYELVNNNSEVYDKKKHRLDPERGHESDWPIDWMDVGDGSAGAPPPPWSYVPKLDGKRDLCHMPPRRGRCKQKLTRWGYNPYTDQCVNFTWSGCGGNQNNFEKKLRCEEECVVPPPSGCDSDSKIPIPYV